MFTQRNIWSMIGLTIITIGFYQLYWFYVTKQELNKARAQIPTFFLFFVPFANFYFLYKFAEGFCKAVLRNESQTVAYFLLVALLIFIAPFIYQHKMNNFQVKNPQMVP